MDPTEGVQSSNASARSWLNVVISLGKIVVAGGLLIWLLSSDRLDFSSLQSIHHWEYVWLAGACLLLNMVLLVWRWYWLLGIQGLRIDWWTALRITWVGYFATVFLPGSAGGDLAKAYASCRRQARAKTRAVSTVLMDRALGLQSILFIGSVTGLAVLTRGATARQASVIWGAIVCLGVTSLGFLLLLWRRSSGAALRLLPRRFRRAFEDSLESYREARWRLYVVWFYSCLCNVTVILAYVLAGAALGNRAALSQVIVVPLVIVANSVPVSPGGLGVGEAAGSQLFAEFGLDEGALIVLLIRLGWILLSLPGIITVFAGTKTRERQGQACLQKS